MDPLLSFFICMAVIATIILLAAHLFIFLTHTTVKTNSTTQTIVKTSTSSETSMDRQCNKTIGLQVPENKSETADQGCDAGSTRYRAMATEQIQAFRESHNQLQDFVNAKCGNLELQLQRFTKNMLEQSVTECQMLELIREDILRKQQQFQSDITTEIQSFKAQTQDNLQKLQESLYYEVQSVGPSN